MLAPSSVLQHRYLVERLRGVPPGRFIEVGVGRGEMSKALLARGWRGVGYELSPDNAVVARETTAGFPYEVRVGDWLQAPTDERADLVLSSMVLEHLSDEDEAAYLERARVVSDRLVLLVPASPRHWGIEDEIAGHFRRYSRDLLGRRLRDHGWHVDHLVGLTYPLANLLLPISNRLVARNERDRLALPLVERTQLSGDRHVPGKTEFPPIARLVLNPVVLYPWYLLQKALRDAEDALILYAEASRPPR
jgi:SAM-dependent methyltransferase